MKPTAAFAALLAVAAASIGARADVEVYRGASGALPLTLDLFGWVQPRLSIQQHDLRPTVDFRPNPAFTVQRARLGAESRLGPRATVHFEVELAREIAQPIDLYATVSPLVGPAATLTLAFGQMRVPFSRQNLLPSKSWQLPDGAYFVTPKFLVDRDLGATLTADFLDRRIRAIGGVFDGNEPGRGQTQNADPYFLYGGRLEVAPLGAAPRFEGDVRPPDERRRLRVVAGGGALSNRLEDKHYRRLYLGADAGVWFRGASLYGEVYRRTDRATCAASSSDPCPTGTAPPAPITATGFNLQAGYFPPLPWVQEHIELAFRVQRFDPDVEVSRPAADAGARDLDQSNPTWGYLGITAGLNLFLFERGHDLKLQASYELRNETKACLEGQSGNGCTGYIDNDLFLLQGTVAF